MSNKLLTDWIIKKALECCIISDCPNCPMGHRATGTYNEHCGTDLVKNALDLINRKDAEIDRKDINFIDLLKTSSARADLIYETQAEKFELFEKIEQLKAENERLKSGYKNDNKSLNDYLSDLVKNQKDTIDKQEVEIERLKEEVELLHSDYTYKFVKEKAKAEARKEFAELLEQRFALCYGMKIDFTNASKMLKNLLKELEGE